MTLNNTNVGTLQPVSSEQHKAREHRKVRQVFGVALLIEGILATLLLTLLAFGPAWSVLPSALVGLGGYLVLPPRVGGGLGVALSVLLVATSACLWLAVS